MHMIFFFSSNSFIRCLFKMRHHKLCTNTSSLLLCDSYDVGAGDCNRRQQQQQHQRDDIDIAIDIDTHTRHSFGHDPHATTAADAPAGTV